MTLALLLHDLGPMPVAAARRKGPVTGACGWVPCGGYWGPAFLLALADPAAAGLVCHECRGLAVLHATISEDWTVCGFVLRPAHLVPWSEFVAVAMPRAADPDAHAEDRPLCVLCVAETRALGWTP